MSEKSRTNGGIYTKNRDENVEYKTLKDMWEVSIGKCPVFRSEQRSLKCQALLEIGNLLSQINTIYYKVNNEKIYLTKEDKENILYISKLVKH